MNANTIDGANAPVEALLDSQRNSSPALSSYQTKPLPSAVGAEGIFLSEADAQATFDTIRNDASYVWEYLEDGCMARAHKMCRFLSEKGYYSEKIRIENANGTWLCPFGLVVQPAETPDEPVHLRFHVAVIVLVQSSAGAEERIIDPSFFDGPVPQKAWSKRFINADSISITKQIDYEAQRKEYRRFPHDVFDNTLCWTNKDPDMQLTNKTLASLKDSIPQNSRFYLTINPDHHQTQD